MLVFVQYKVPFIIICRTFYQTAVEVQSTDIINVLDKGIDGILVKFASDVKLEGIANPLGDRV